MITVTIGIAIIAIAAGVVYLIDFARASRRDPLTPQVGTAGARRARRAAGMYVRRRVDGPGLPFKGPELRTAGPDLQIEDLELRLGGSDLPTGFQPQHR